MKTKTVQRKVVHLEEGFKEFVDKIEREGPLKGSDHHEIFTLAMVMGFNSGEKKKIKKRLSGGFFREDTLTSDEKALVNTIAIADTGNILVIKEENIDERYTIAEEYAMKGFELLKDLLALPGSFQKKLELSLKKELKEINKISL
jgi:hypothetical protein